MSNLKRNGIITLEQAKKQFNEYYDSRNKTPAGRLRGKLFDAMYQKKRKNVLTPGEPGSEKYLLEEGVRTFDMKGVDYFPEGESIEIDSDGDKIKGTSKGATYYKSSDGNINNLDSPDSSGRRKSNKIYGPRTKNKEL